MIEARLLSIYLSHSGIGIDSGLFHIPMSESEVSVKWYRSVEQGAVHAVIGSVWRCIHVVPPQKLWSNRAATHIYLLAMWVGQLASA